MARAKNKASARVGIFPVVGRPGENPSALVAFRHISVLDPVFRDRYIDAIEFAISVWNPVDVFSWETGKQLAQGRLDSGICSMYWMADERIRPFCESVLLMILGHPTIPGRVRRDAAMQLNRLLSERVVKRVRLAYKDTPLRRFLEG